MQNINVISSLINGLLGLYLISHSAHMGRSFTVLFEHQPTHETSKGMCLFWWTFLQYFR